MRLLYFLRLLSEVLRECGIILKRFWSIVFWVSIIIKTLLLTLYFQTRRFARQGGVLRYEEDISTTT